ncbi:MAG: hypothetical protein FJ087_08130 [Deltaproteobacteria bacterium]|nr:hypothetical protein [Deltaproteobacteria bacterium]
MERRSWPLIAVAGAFGLLLAVAPFLFIFERSPYSDALAAYDRLCRASAAVDVAAFRADLVGREALRPDPDVAALMPRLACVPRGAHDASFVPVAHQAWGPDRAYLLTLTPKAGGTAVQVRFRVEEDVVRWEP